MRNKISEAGFSEKARTDAVDGTAANITTDVASTTDTTVLAEVFAERMDRRRACARILGLAMGGGAFFMSRSALAEAIRLVLCEEKPATPALASACAENSIPSEKERVKFLAAMRSAPEFQELARELPPEVYGESRKLRCLYPGSGSHVAPLMLVSTLMDAGAIDSAEFVYTEIDEDAVLDLHRNLGILGQMDSHFSYKGKEPRKPVERKAQKYIFELDYKGKKITIRFELNCCGRDWFKKRDAARTDVLIMHDSNSWRVNGPLWLMLQYLKVCRQACNSTKPRVVVMEDLTRMPVEEMNSDYSPSRKFDLELLGSIKRGKYPYGHREIADVKDPVEGIIWGEVDKPDCLNGAVVNIYPDLDSLDERDLMALMGISMVAHQPTWGYKELAYAGDVEALGLNETYLQSYGSPFMIDFLGRALRLLETYKKINPALERALALRILQCVFCYGTTFINRWLDTFHRLDRETGFEYVSNVLRIVGEHLGAGEKDTYKKELGEIEQALKKLRYAGDTRCEETRVDMSSWRRPDLRYMSCKRPLIEENMKMIGKKLGAAADQLFENI